MQAPTSPPGSVLVASTARPRSVRLLPIVLGVSWVAIAAPLLIWGFDYYMTPLSQRSAHPQDDLFSPTGLAGNRLGIAGTLMIAFGVAMYVVRKRWRVLQGVGRLRNWLSVHIWLCTLGPFLVLLHTSFKVGGIVSIAFWSMVVVVVSGVLGRYVYVHLPRADNGRFLEMREVEEAQREIRTELEAAGVAASTLEAIAVPVPDRTPSAFQAFSVAMRAGRMPRGALAGLSGSDATVLDDLAKRYRRLAINRAVFVPFGRIFRYWHAIHLPLAIVMALILLVHIAVAFLLGYAWTPAP